MSEIPKKGTREYAIADALSRPNAMNGLYQKLEFPLEWENLQGKNAVYITHLANLGDRLIKEAVENKKDLDNHKVRQELRTAFHGGMTGASLAIKQDKILRFFGFRGNK